MKSSLISAQVPTVYDIRFNMMAMMLKFKFKTEHKATDLKSINIRYLLTIYRHLAHNDIPVIEDNSFSNLPNLQYL